MITIYKSDGTIRTTQHESPDSYFNPKISDEENAQINFEIGEYINFEVGDYILLYGFYLTLYSIPTPLKKSSNNRYSYQLKFESPRYGMSKVNLLLFDNTTSLQTPAYNTLATYSKGNVVKYHTLYWECVSDSPVTGISPEEGQYWQLKSNVTHEVPEYNPATTYTSGDEVTYNLCIWKHIGAVDTVGVHPEEGNSWTQITTAPDFDFSAVLTPRRWAQLFCDNMNRARPKENWSVGYTISDQPKEQAFTNAYVLDALGGTAELYNTEFWIGQLSRNNYTINIGKKSNQTSLVMKYGGGNGFKNIERDEVTENNKITRLVALGGTSNIPSTYRGGSKRLMLPNSYYLDADNIDLNNPLEGTMTWDDIYPCMLHATDDWNASTAYTVGEMVVYNNISWTCLVGNKNQTPSEGTYWQISEGTVTTAVSQYKLIDKNLTFNPLDPNLIMHDGTVPKVHFITGNLAGYEFPIAGYNKDTKQITIQQIQDANDSYLPTAGYTFSENDQFNIVDFYMPSEYISKAENLLKAKATEWLNQYSKDQVSYKGEVDTVWATDGKVELNCGDVIEVIDTDFGIDLPYRITDLKRYITEPYKYEIVLDDTPYVPTKLSSMKNEIVKNSTYIQYNNLDTQMAKTRTYKGAAEAINMAFDPGSKYFTDGIAPLFVKTAMALFGTETQQYTLTGVSVATYLNTPNVISWTAGVITDNTQQDTARSWNISAGLFTATDANTSYYAYIRCNKTTSSSEATILFTETQYQAIGDDNYYYFLLGTLTKLINSVRQFYTSNGFTFISGNNIVTGKVQSQDGISYIDLDNNEGHLGTPSKYISWDENGVKINEPLVVSPSGVTSPIACFRGAYTTNIYYYKGDTVTYDGSTWQFINDTPAQNITPVEGDNWTCVSAKGYSGDSVKLLYRYEIDKPTKPTGSNPNGWSNTPDKEIIAITHGTNFTLKDGYYVSPAISHSSIIKNRIYFSTTKVNQSIAIELSVSSEPTYDCALIGILDDNNLDRNSNYTKKISGITTIIAIVDIPNIGSHFIDVGYAKDGSDSNNDDNCKYRIVDINKCWISTGYTISGLTTWSDPVIFINDNKSEEYIYAIEDSEITLASPKSDKYIDDFIPKRTYTDYSQSLTWSIGSEVIYNSNYYRCIIANSSTNVHLPTETLYWKQIEPWTDNPQGVSLTKRYEYISKRTKVNGVWGEFSIPTIWARYSVDGDKGDQGATGNYYEHRYAVNGSSTDAPSLINTDTSPSGWTTTLPTQNLYQFTWMITSEKTSGGALVGTWSSPVRITGTQGAAGAQGSTGPAMSFYGTWSASSTYIGNSNIVSVVIYNSTYYIARYDVGGPFSSSTTPNNDTSHWNSLGASFSSIATGLLLAQEAYIDNLYVSKLSTSTNPYNFLLSILDSSLGIFRNKADSSYIINAMVAIGKDISSMNGEGKPALVVRDVQWQGDYNASKIYYKDDRVYYSGYGTYMFMHDWLETETPTAGFLPTNLTYWRQLSTNNLGGGSFSEIGSDGIYTNGFGVDAIPSFLSNICIAGLLEHRNGDSDGISAAVTGLDLTSDSDGASKSYGGYFNRLFVQSELDNVTTTSSTDDLTLSKESNHTIHYYGSGTKRIYLPTVNYRDVGLKFVISSLNGKLLIGGNGTNVININPGTLAYGQKWTATCIYDGTNWIITYVHD